MDLPPDKAKLLRNYDLEKKWEIICDQDMVQAKDSPAHYLNKLRTYLDPKASRSHRVSLTPVLIVNSLELEVHVDAHLRVRCPFTAFRYNT